MQLVIKVSIKQNGLDMDKSYVKTRIFFVTVMLLFSASVTASQNNFNGVKWTVDTSNSPSQDKSGSGFTPSVIDATNSKASFTFKIVNDSKQSDERQEFKFERRKGYHWMSGKFKLSPKYKSFDKIVLAQTQDDRAGPADVFSVYHVRKSGNHYLFGVYGETKEEDNHFNPLNTVKITLGKEYSLSIKTNTKGDSSYETARLYDNSGKKIWQHTIVGGGHRQQYKKVGVYRLPDGHGPVEVTWRRLKFYTGKK